MLELFKKSPRFFVGAILVHLFFIVLFGVGFHFKSKERAATAIPESVKVTTIDEKEVKKELAKLKAQDDSEEKRRKEAIQKRKQEEQRLAKIKKEREIELKKQKQEKKRQEELERKRKAEEKKDRAQKEAELKEKMLAEEARMQAEAEAAALRKAELKKKQTLIDKHMNMIENAIYQRWIKPPTASQGLVAELRVKLIPTGDVISIELYKSSGDTVFDKSVTAAVRKASPLPLPPAEENLFDTFRELHLPMRADKKT